MKILKLFTVIIVTVMMFANTNKSFAGDNPKNIESLKNQITNEIKNILNTPVCLNYSNTNLNGTIKLTIGVKNNGKICIYKVDGDNNCLISYVSKKISNKSLWTLTKYAGETFQYLIKFKIT